MDAVLVSKMTDDRQRLADEKAWEERLKKVAKAPSTKDKPE